MLNPSEEWRFFVRASVVNQANAEGLEGCPLFQSDVNAAANNSSKQRFIILAHPPALKEAILFKLNFLWIEKTLTWQLLERKTNIKKMQIGWQKTVLPVVLPPEDNKFKELMKQQWIVNPRPP